MSFFLENFLASIQGLSQDTQKKRPTPQLYTDFQVNLGDCLLSDSPWDCFSWLLGRWREFRPSSSWVFGSWEVMNSGAAEGTENADSQNLKGHFDSQGTYYCNDLAKVFCSADTHGVHVTMSLAPNPPEIPQTLHFTSICQNWTLPHQYHQPTSFDAMFPLIVSPTVIAVHSSLESSDSRWFESFRILSFVWISETSWDQAAIVDATECRNRIEYRGIYIRIT